MSSPPPLTPHATTRLARVRVMLFDVDGILTDGRLHYGPDGELLKAFHVLDGQGIKMLHQAGISTAILSARQSTIVARRAADLGIAHVLQGAHDKYTAFLHLQRTLDLPDTAFGFIGDDVIDLPVLMRAGFSASVPNGHADVRARVDYVTQASGGQGAVRELCDLLLRVQGHYERLLSTYLP